MTRDEHRAKCIEAMADAIKAKFYGMADWLRTTLATAAFDALPPAGARVVPAEATEGMIYIGELAKADGADVAKIFASMARVGGLTNPPETKP